MVALKLQVIIMNDKTKTTKTKQESSQVECIALKTLNSSGMVKKGESFTCSKKDYEFFKSVKAV